MVLNENQRRLRRAKQSERDFGKFLLLHNGPDPNFRHISSSTGRVGHYYELQFDVVSKDYAGENKQVRVPKKLLDWWDQIVEVAGRHDKQPLLRLDPTNDGKHQEMHIITAERHAELLEIENRQSDREWC